MATRIFVNLPVKNLQQSINFFTRLGFSFNKQFMDDKAGCMIIGENIYAMLLTEERFKEFTKKPVANAHNSTEVLIALDAKSKAEVDDLIQKATAAGGKIYREPEDHGWMYGHSFADLDGHQWEILYMEANAVPE